MDHPNAAIARNAFTALAAGDIAPAFALMTDDFLMLNDIGAGPWREVHGKDGVLDFWTRWMELFDNTFAQEMLDVVGYDDRILIVMHETGTVGRVPYDNRALYVIDVRDGTWPAMRTHDMDPDNCRRFWAAVPAPDEAPVS